MMTGLLAIQTAWARRQVRSSARRSAKELQYWKMRMTTSVGAETKAQGAAIVKMTRPGGLRVCESERGRVGRMAKILSGWKDGVVVSGRGSDREVKRMWLDWRS